jgi:hypothetical protein
MAVVCFRDSQVKLFAYLSCISGDPNLESQKVRKNSCLQSIHAFLVRDGRLTGGQVLLDEDLSLMQI